MLWLNGWSKLQGTDNKSDSKIDKASNKANNAGHAKDNENNNGINKSMMRSMDQWCYYHKNSEIDRYVVHNKQKKKKDMRPSN